MATDRRPSSRRVARFDDLESRAMLGVVHPAVELMSLHTTRLAIVRGTIRGQFTQMEDPLSSIGVIYTDFSGRGKASSFGRVTYIAHDVYNSGVHLGGGDATLTTSKGETLAVEYGISSTGKLSGEVLGSASTGRFAQSSGTLSGAYSFNFKAGTFKLMFTIKPG